MTGAPDDAAKAAALSQAWEEYYYPEVAAALAAAEKALEAYGVHEEFDYPRDIAESCGMFCDLCERHVDKPDDHAETCALRLVRAARRERPAASAEAHDPGHPHLIKGEFQSDKYPACPRGKVPLSVKDTTAQDLLWEYAQRRRAVDAEFAADLEIALMAKGFSPPLKRGDNG